MKICILSDKFPPDPGGLATSARRLARGLVGTGHRVHVVAPDVALLPGQVVQIVTDNGVVVHRFGVHKRADDTRVDWFELVVKLNREVGFDLVHGYYLAGAGLVTVYVARYVGVPAVVSARGNDLERAVFDAAQIGVVWALERATAVTAVSHDLAQKAKALADCNPIVIHNGVKAELFAPAPPDEILRAELGLKANTPIIGFVGEARLKKGLTVLLNAFAQVAVQAQTADRPVPTLLLVGGVRKDNKDIVRVFKAQNPTLRVRVTDYFDHAELPRYYNLLDINLVPSLRDGLPNSLLEGLACGRATIATKVGGILDVVEHGVNGWLIEPGDVAGLATAVSQLLAQPELRQKLGANGRQTVITHFTPKKELQANLSLYQQLLSE
jgi:glycosyltransferase involved in cell wall biosynthesis